jgi:hypothetical protein
MRYPGRVTRRIRILPMRVVPGLRIRVAFVECGNIGIVLD